MTRHVETKPLGHLLHTNEGRFQNLIALGASSVLENFTIF